MSTNTYTLHRRTFAAKSFEKGSAERDGLNRDSLTSEYYPSKKFIIRTPALMSDGTPNPVQKFHEQDFTTKREAEAAMKFLTTHTQNKRTP